MFNPKQRLEQIRKNKIFKQQNTTSVQNNPISHFTSFQPTFSQKTNNDQQMSSRLTRLQHIVTQLSTKLNESNNIVQSLKQQNSQLQTKILKLQYENSQLKSHQSPKDSQQKVDRRQSKKSQLKTSQVNKFQSQFSQEIIEPQVQEALEQIKKQPLQSILKRKQQNFRALKIDSKQNATGNKYLKQFAQICKHYNKNLKKPALVIKLNSNDFQ